MLRPRHDKTRRRRGSLKFERLEARTVLSAAPVISEFVASNDNSLLDGDGASSDWIEIYNPTSETFNLAGWHLTDRANNLDKWTFPNAPQSVLGAGEYLIVFASSQDTETYIDPLGYLHTDFALRADGEFLGLTDPSETIVSAYAPSFPEQLRDVAYGLETPTVALIDDSNSTSVLVPTSGALDGGASPAWTQIGFNDASWATSDSGPGTGFDSSISQPPGPEDGVELNDLVGGDLTDPEQDSTLAVSFVGGASSNSPSGEEPAKALDNSTSTKWLAFAPSGTFYEVSFLDEQPRIVDSYTITSANDAPQRDPYSWTLSGTNDGINYTVIDTRVAQDFADRFETRLYDFTNTTAYKTLRFDFQTEFGVTGSNQPVAIQMAEIELLSSQDSNFDSLIDVDIETDWNTHKSSAYQRVAFDVGDPATLGALSLEMQYNDGFVAYLNGVKVAEANSPTLPNWQSLATTERDSLEAFIPESFDLSPFHHLLVPGENVLAIHAFNADDTSNDLLSRPSLSAKSVIDAVPDVFFFETPTPGTANGEGELGFVETPTFSVARGFYETGFDLTISGPSDAAIYYTTNGDAPTPDTGVLYTGPIGIDQTTVVKAGAFRDDYYDSKIETHSYLFVRDVVSQSYQSTLAAGFPTSWGGVTPDYGIDPDVIGTFDSDGNSLGGDLFGGEYASTIQDDLLAIPTLSIVMNTDDLFGLNGIYTNSTNGGVAYERATSVELINPDGSQGFQIDAGIRIQGGAFRQHDLSKKHSLRLLFKDDYGPTKLEYPLFGPDAVDRFDTVTLRMESNDGYAWSGAGTQPQYARDAFGSRSHAALGQVAPHGNRMHLYINGVYWGVYNPNERPDASFAAEYYGGDKENWDAINDGSPIDGDLDTWNTMIALARDAGPDAINATQRAAAYQRLQGNHPDGTNNPAYEDYLDVDNYIDYLLVNFYMGNVDWPHRNWYAARERGPDSTGFKFHMWDAESTLNLFGSNVNTNRLGANVEAAEAYSYLRQNADFLLRFADRAHRALFNDGALTPTEAISRYESILAEMDDAIVAESARWGDMHRSTPLTKAEWVAEGQSVIETFLTDRTEIFVNHLRSNRLYPSVDAPVFSQHGGTIPTSGFQLSLSTQSGSTYYTLNGTDPRASNGLPVGAIYDSPVTITPGTTINARTLSGGTWSALNEATFATIPLPGDYNEDLTVDEADYAVWSSDYGTASSPADGNRDGIVNAADYTIWRDNLGASAAPPVMASVLASQSTASDDAAELASIDAPIAITQGTRFMPPFTTRVRTGSTYETPRDTIADHQLSDHNTLQNQALLLWLKDSPDDEPLREVDASLDRQDEMSRAEQSNDEAFASMVNDDTTTVLGSLSGELAKTSR